MKINLNFIQSKLDEEVTFSIQKITPAVTKAMELLSDNVEETKSKEEKEKSIPFLLGKIEDTFYKVNRKDIYYMESLDRKVFIYTEKKSYELNEKLYVLEEMLEEEGFVRISKSMLLNVNKIYSFVPTFSGNLEACLYNKEKVVISRRYVANLKKQLGMGEV